MTLKYRLSIDIVARTAMQLNFELNTIKSNIFIIKNNKCFNGKSLIGILNNNLRFNDIIEIRIETPEKEIFKIKTIFDKIGREV